MPKYSIIVARVETFERQIITAESETQAWHKAVRNVHNQRVSPSRVNFQGDTLLIREEGQAQREMSGVGLPEHAPKKLKEKAVKKRYRKEG